MKWQRCVSVMVGLMLVLTASAARADVFNMGQGLTSLDFVTVGNPGNANDTHGDGYGAVDYTYQIGKYEVTAGQYTTFLNNVATSSDPHGLYNTDMMDTSTGCQINQSGSSGSYTYSVAAERANRPVNFVSWGDAARFMNWLHNGQPSGAQGAGTTETGAYTLNGATTRYDLEEITRNANAKYWIPTENEWYKAAYHKNDGATRNYFDYPTSSDSKPSNDLINPDPGNNANFGQDGGLTIGSPYWTTEVGAFENSDSSYGTFDQGGNVGEWNEAAIDEWSRGVRGGRWDTGSMDLHAFTRYMVDSSRGSHGIGFRVTTVPEPGSITLMLCGALAGLLWWRRRK